MELPSPAPALAVAILVIFAAHSPLLSHSSPLPFTTSLHFSSKSTPSPFSPPGDRSSSHRSSPPPSLSPLSPPHHRHHHHRNPPPPPAPLLSTKPGDASGSYRRLRPPRPPVSCAGNSTPDCVEHLPPKGSGSDSFVDTDRGTARRNRTLNLGKKVGVAFLAVFSVLQIVFGGFLLYKRWEIRKAGYVRHVVSGSAP